MIPVILKSDARGNPGILLAECECACGPCIFPANVHLYLDEMYPRAVDGIYKFVFLYTVTVC